MPTHCQGICQSKFEIGEDGNYRNRRLEKERTKQKERSEKQRDNANLRWQKDANAMPTHMPEDTNDDASPIPESCFPSPSPNKDTKTPKSEWEVAHGVELPEALRTQNCLEAVRLWLRYKSEKREAYKKTGLTAAMTKWAREFTPSEFPSIVEHSIASGWKGIKNAIKDAIHYADAVITTTPMLAKEIRTINEKVYVVPNCLDLTHNQWSQIKEKKCQLK